MPITTAATIDLIVVLIILSCPKYPIFFLRLPNNKNIHTIADILVARANPANCRYLTNIILSTIFIIIAIAPFIIGVLVSFSA